MIGKIINDRYRLDTELGHGGMGVVYKGHDLLLERDIAIKLLNQVVINQDEWGRLFNEAKLIARLRHQNIVSVFDVGDYDGSPFLIMEYVDGGSLREHHPGELDVILKIITQITRALQYTHEKGIIHRDLKPENVLLEQDGTVKIVDFGIARSDITQLTSQGRISGTAHYMAPEILKGEKIDSRTDLYSLGVILYELTTGQLPFYADSLMGLIQKTLFEDVIPPIELNPDLPQELNELILRLLSKDPNSRPSSAREVLQILETCDGIPSQFVDKIPTCKPTRVQPPKHNLPTQASSFIGRETDLFQIGEILAESSCRLLTLVGIGGIGKTRLAIQSAYESIEEYVDGVWIIELASLTEADLLPQKVAALFGVSALQVRDGHNETDVLIDYLKDKNLLLVIDNCEHLIEACANFSETLLKGCPQVKILATSREDLRIPGERLFPVAPLQLPPDDTAVENLRTFEAVRLFVERAASIQHGFDVSLENGQAITQICRRLDGIPLAIELAAARVKVITPEQIAVRLYDRFNLLTSGSRTALPRHKTLEAMMDWSYNLLSEPECVLLRRLAIFSGGWTLEAAEKVGSIEKKDTGEILELLSQLVDKSLVFIDKHDHAVRYGMLETVRQYGINKLSEQGEIERIRQQHADYFVKVAEIVDPGLRGGQQIQCLAILDAEHDNLRVALRWALDTHNTKLIFRIVSALGWFWFLRGYWKESKSWLTQSLHLSEDSDPILKAKAIYRAGGLEIIRGKLTGTIELVEEALQLCREQEDQEGQAWCLNLLGQAGTWGYKDVEKAVANLTESIELFNLLGDNWGRAWSLRYLGQVADLKGDIERSIELQQDALNYFEEMGDIWNCAHSFYLMGTSFYQFGRFEEARWAFERSLENCELVEDRVMAAHALRGLAQLAIQRTELDLAEQLSQNALEALQKIGDENCAAGALRDLGEISRLKGNYDLASDFLRSSLLSYEQLGNDGPICITLMRFAALAECTGNHRKAVLLLAAVEGNLEQLLSSSPIVAEEHTRLVSKTREQLGHPIFEQLWLKGKELNVKAAIQLAIDNELL